jgi:hypothetical protein
MRIFLFVENFDLCPTVQYILVRVIPSCFHFSKMCLSGKSPVKVQPEIPDIISMRGVVQDVGLFV